MKDMKARPAKSSEHNALGSTKVITHRESKHNIIICIYNLYYPKFCANNMIILRQKYKRPLFN